MWAAAQCAVFLAALVCCKQPVSNRHDYGWGDNVVPVEHARIHTLPEVPIGMIVNLRPKPLPFVNKAEAVQFMGAYCAIRELNSRSDAAVRYRLDALDMRSSVAEGIAGAAALEAAGTSVFMPPTFEAQMLIAAAVNSAGDDSLFELSTDNLHPDLDAALTATPSANRIQPVSGTCRLPSFPGKHAYGRVWRVEPSYCDEVHAIMSLVKAMGWKLISVVRTLDVYGSAWDQCYPEVVRALWGSEEPPCVVCLTALRLPVQRTEVMLHTDLAVFDPVTGLTTLQSDLAPYIGIQDAVKCFKSTPVSVVILWMKQYPALQVLRAIRDAGPELAELRLVGTADWATFRNATFFVDSLAVPSDMSFLEGVLYFEPVALESDGKAAVRQCVESLRPEEHPFIRDTIEEVHMCRIPRPYTSDDPMPPVKGYADAPVCPPDATLAGITLAPEGFGAYTVIRRLDAVHRMQGSLTADAIGASGLFGDPHVSDGVLRLAQHNGPGFERRIVGRYVDRQLVLETDALVFGGGYQSWFPAYRVRELAGGTRTALNSAVAVTLALSLACQALIFVLRREPAVRKTSPGLSQLVLLGVDIVLAAQFKWNTTSRSVLDCTAKVWVFLAGLGLVLGALLAKLYRLDAIFNRSGQALSGGARDMRDRVVIRRVVVPVVLGELALAALYSSLPGGPPRPWIDMLDNTAEAVRTCCPSSDPALEYAAIGAAVVYNAAIVLCTLYYAARTRGAASAYSEADHLAMTVYFYALACAVFMPLYYSIFFMWQPVEEDAAAGLPRYRVLGVVMCALGTIAILFAPKAVYALNQRLARKHRRAHKQRPDGRVVALPHPCSPDYTAAVLCDHRAHHAAM